MTDTTTARPAPPAWLNLDIIPEALRDEMHAHTEPSRLGWVEPMLDWFERALILDAEYAAACGDAFGGTIPAEVSDVIDGPTGYTALYAVVSLIEEIYGAFDEPANHHRAARCEEIRRRAAKILGSD